TSGEDVFWLQNKLTELGYYQGTITGSYYQGTRDAVKAYQQEMGLAVDGQAGRRTQESLYAEVLATPTPSPSPTPAPTPTTVPSPAPGETPTPAPTQSVKINFTAKPL
ncbi:MAG TPA: peptidoglycan-binding domain-containing protein, partial [Clostridia bacterium]|nr:peptidoglycan-binding domain-containing protein [Clostridia bacterium]